MLLTAALLLIASQLPILAAGIAKSGAFRARDHRYDNREPRVWLEQNPDPRRRRANAAQSNSFEALPFLFAAALFALFAHANLAAIHGLLVAWIILRSFYIWLYVNDHASLRSLVWSIALAVNIALLFAPFYG
ncbi:MAG: MAPEG family protein [Betaproteobacteria bacterium]|nr:MAPEG family protein [Betaproteobacteria bacterium]